MLCYAVGLPPLEPATPEPHSGAALRPVWCGPKCNRSARLPAPEHLRRSEALETFRQVVASQFDAANSAGEIFPTGQHLYELIQSALYGSLIRVRYGEPFFTHETVGIKDVLALEVQSM